MHKQIFLLLVLSPFSTVVWSDLGDQYSFFKIGSMSVNNNNVANLTALGYTYGIGISQRLSFEFEGNITVQGGKYSTNNASGHYEVLSFGSYLVHRESFGQNFYGKAKIGMTLEQINIHNEESQVETPTDGINASAGLGVGYAFPIGNSKGTIEFEATILEKNINLYTFGLNVSF